MGVNLPRPDVEALLTAKTEILAIVAALEVSGVVVEYLKTGRLELDVVPEWLADALAGPIGEAERTLGEPLFELLIRAPSGVSLSRDPGAQEGKAVEMVQRMIGFATALPFAIAGIKQSIEALTGGNAPTALLEAIEKIPEDLGINWALGTTMANIFELATGRPLAEAINEQVRPFRFEWPQVRALLRQGHLTEAEATERLVKIGVRDQDLPLALKLDRVLLSLSDLQQAYLYGLKDESWIRDYLDHAGLDPEDIDVLVSVYLTRAQTTGAGELRTVAQTGYLEGHLSEPQYRDLLKQANVPQASIDLEIEAANLTKGWGRLQLTVSEIKAQFQQGRLDQHAAILRLVRDGYTEDDALLLIQSWLADSRAGKLGLSESRILSYLLGGLYSRQQAYAALLDQGYKADDAAFLVDNPSSFGGVFRYPLTPATVLAALKDGDLSEEQARQLLDGLSMDPTEADLRIKVAEQAGRRAQKPKAPAKALSEAQILDALRQGLAEPSWALTELSLIGYSDADAQLLVALELTREAGEPPAGWLTLA